MPRLEPRTVRLPNQRGLWWVYMIPTYHPDDMGLPEGDRRIVCGYVGETSRWDALVRFCEHLDEKPWADTVVDPDRCGAPIVVDRFDPRLRRFQVLRQRFTSDEAACLVEQGQIELNRPLYNVTHNLRNPDQIPLWVQARHRAERDALAGVPERETWAYLNELRRREQSGEQSGELGGPRWSWSTIRIRIRRLSRRDRRRIGWLLLWATATVLLWVAAAQYAQVVSTLRLGGISAALTGAGVLRLWSRRRLVSRAGRAVLLLTALALLATGHPFG